MSQPSEPPSPIPDNEEWRSNELIPSFDEFGISSDLLYAAKQAQLGAQTQQARHPSLGTWYGAWGYLNAIDLTTAEETINHRYQVEGIEKRTAHHILIRHGAQFVQLGLDLSNLPKDIRDLINEIGKHEHINWKLHKKLLARLGKLTVKENEKLDMVYDQLNELLRKFLVARNRARKDYVMKDGRHAVLYRVFVTDKNEYVLMVVVYDVTGTTRQLITAYIVDKVDPSTGDRVLVRRVRGPNARQIKRTVEEVEDSEYDSTTEEILYAVFGWL